MQRIPLLPYQIGLSEDEKRELAKKVIGKSFLTRKSDQSINFPMIASSVFVIVVAVMFIKSVINNVDRKNQESFQAKQVSKVEKTKNWGDRIIPTDWGIKPTGEKFEGAKSTIIPTVVNYENNLVRDSKSGITNNLVVSETTIILENEVIMMEEKLPKEEIKSSGYMQLELPWQFKRSGDKPELNCMVSCGYESDCFYRWWSGRGGEWEIVCPLK